MASLNPELVEETEKEIKPEPIVFPYSQHKKFKDTPSAKMDEREVNSSEIDHEQVNRKGRKIMIKMREVFFSIKRVFEDQCLHYNRGENLETTRIYQVWPGKNVFFFHGRLVCGPDPKGLLLTTVSIILCGWIFCVYIGEDLPSHRSKLIITISEILTLLVLGNLILVSSIDPGIIPRSEQDQLEEPNGSRSRAIKKKIVVINGVELKLKYCRTCKIFRPPRSCHCVVCDNCVEKFDHHCPWIGQCIALRNYRFYLTFIISALSFFIYVIYFSCWRIHQKVVKNGSNLFGLVRNCPETLALVLFSFAAILFLTGLAIYHLYLISTNQTAYENFRQRFVGSKSPYDKGVYGNIKEILFVGMPPSRVDFRAEVTSRSWHPTAATSHEV
ncbi:probable protein S-acyltransferase 5 [Humulus lupulus]|uniref:probable protein S-acyltransferase 5 n=1 Tax=Humulus lupulus TaxID=3486 RepID=UPI002B404E94|nr:probable protein S-acyltransferase 5 [Humulus lupulus]